GTEAMALGCPVVAVQTPGKDFEGGVMPPYVSENVVEHVDMGDADGLAKALRRLLEDAEARTALVERAKKFAARYVHPADGALAGRLLSVIDAIRSETAKRRAPLARHGRGSVSTHASSVMTLLDSLLSRLGLIKTVI